jgi:hypothetical protein
LARVTFKAVPERPEMPGLAANFRRVATELRRSPPLRGFLALRCSQKIQQVERFMRDRRRAAIGARRIQLPHEAVMRGPAACVVDALFASAAKFQCSEALARELRFAHGSNINLSCESCGKLKASGVCAKRVAAKTGQAPVVKFRLRCCLIQPRRVLALLWACCACFFNEKTCKSRSFALIIPS